MLVIREGWTFAGSQHSILSTRGPITMQVFHARTVKTSRRARPCFWCGESITTGSPYALWRWAEDSVNCQTINVHPECREAWQNASACSEDYDTIEPGSEARGCWGGRCHPIPVVNEISSALSRRQAVASALQLAPGDPEYDEWIAFAAKLTEVTSERIQ